MIISGTNFDLPSIVREPLPAHGTATIWRVGRAGLEKADPH